MIFMNLSELKRETIFSPCRRYRYTLWREWSMSYGLPLSGSNPIPLRGSSGFVQFIGLNPSTADEVQDDPTIRRCVGFAKEWGFSAMCMTNAFAFRATDPKAMLSDPHPNDVAGRTTLYSPNDHWITTIAREAGLIVAAWGKYGNHLGRGDEIRHLISNLHCLGVNSDGTPKHPLYLRKNTTPIPYA